MLRLLALPLLTVAVLTVLPAYAKTSPGDMMGTDTKAADAKPFNIDADQSLEWRQNDHTYVARGNAKVTRDDFAVTGDTLTAFERPKKNGGKNMEIWKFTAEGHVIISNGKANIYGEHGVYDIDTQIATLTGNDLRMVSNADTLTADDRFEYYEAERKAVAIGNAVAVRAPVAGDANSGRTVKADKMTTYFIEDANKNQVADRIEAEGNVIVLTATDIAKGDKAVYNLTNGKATLTGNVRLSRGPSQLEGGKAEVDFKTGVSRLLSSTDGGQKGRIHGLLVPGAQGGVQGIGASNTGASNAKKTNP